MTGKGFCGAQLKMGWVAKVGPDWICLDPDTA